MMRNLNLLVSVWCIGSCFSGVLQIIQMKIYGDLLRYQYIFWTPLLSLALTVEQLSL